MQGADAIKNATLTFRMEVEEKEKEFVFTTLAEWGQKMLEISIDKDSALELFKKNVPLEPILHPEFPQVLKWYCPNCMREHGGDDCEEKMILYPHCHWCGQRIDWEEFKKKGGKLG